MVFCRRWISSMNSTSPSSRLVSSPARSPAFSMVGPLVLLRLAPMALARMLARVVLPRPGGPLSRMWSSASPRCWAACDGDFEPLLDLGLAGEIGKERRPQRHFQRGVGLGQHVRNHPFSHRRAKHGQSARERQGKRRPAPSGGAASRSQTPDRRERRRAHEAQDFLTADARRWTRMFYLCSSAFICGSISGAVARPEVLGI